MICPHAAPVFPFGRSKRAVRQKDASGKITHYLVDGYPKKEDERGPFFRPWGLVDVDDKPYYADAWGPKLMVR